MSGSLMTHATLAQLAAGETMFLIIAVALAVAAFVWRRAGYQRHLRRIAEIERRIALRSGEQVLV